MALHATARESNVLDSIKKYLVDNLVTTENIQLTFDASLNAPGVTQNNLADKWVVLDPGQMELGTLSDFFFDIYCCTRKDNEGFRLAQLRDTVMGYLTNDGTVGDGKTLIPFYQSSKTVPWVLLGGIVIIKVIESNRMEGPKGTKYKILTVRVKFASKI